MAHILLKRSDSGSDEMLNFYKKFPGGRSLARSSVTLQKKPDKKKKTIGKFLKLYYI
jgi:hypothetical protein